MWYLAIVSVFLLRVPVGQARPSGRPGTLADRLRMLPKSAIVQPVFETRIHYAGQVWAAITNYGLFGAENQDRADEKDRQALHIEYSPSFEFPAGSRNDYLWVGGLWVGGVIGTDTLASLPVNGVSNSVVGEMTSYDTITESSSLPGSPYYDPAARADQQYYARYTDTLISLAGTDELDFRPHKPLHIEISQTSYAWADVFARQFIIIACWIRNIGRDPISKLTCGVYVDADVLNEKGAGDLVGSADDISGFLRFAPSINNPGAWDPMNVAWTADNDGDPVGNSFPLFSPRGALGIRLLRVPPMERFSFNWWAAGNARGNWGPVRADHRPPQVQGGLGSPQGDRNAYYLMTNGEIDYGQLLANVDHTAQGWRAPLRFAGCDLADGTDTKNLLSVGPSCTPLFPGDSVPFVFALCAGDNVHVDPSEQFDCNSPGRFIDGLDLSDLEFSATWAAWVYDTPGIDTDGDGYAGESRNSSRGRLYYTGDLGPLPGPGINCGSRGGAPDWSGPSGPPCPAPGDGMTIQTLPSEVIIRWSGRASETTPDPISKKRDFEGYRLYISPVNSPDQYSLIATWDLENYRRYILRGPRWMPEDSILSGEQLEAIYSEATVDSIRAGYYSVPSSGTCLRDTIDRYGFRVERCSYFETQFANRGNTYRENDTTEVNIIQRLGDSTTVVDGDTLTFGYYEARLTHLNPSRNLYVAITAFDVGDPRIHLPSLESLRGACSQFVIPIYSADVVSDSGLHVSVYPNPYRISFPGRNGRPTTYFNEGFEAPEKRGSSRGMVEQDRRIWFINLPAKATIRIYSLDGDLVRTIHHDWPRAPGAEGLLTDYSSRAYWDLVTRNTQAVVSGIYIYRVDSDLGSQVGKIVIIK